MVYLNFLFQLYNVMRISVLLFLALPGLFSCESNPRHDLIVGAWKIDSTYTYYNGFDFTQREANRGWATYIYEKDGMMKEVKTDYFQSYFFKFLSEDTLVVSSARGGEHATFNILYLDAKQMALRKSKEPVFSGGNQERYEIRYFSRIPLPADSLNLFSDPRNLVE